jgi:hypothetical protein
VLPSAETEMLVLLPRGASSSAVVARAASAAATASALAAASSAVATLAVVAVVSAATRVNKFSKFYQNFPKIDRSGSHRILKSAILLFIDSKYLKK